MAEGGEMVTVGGAGGGQVMVHGRGWGEKQKHKVM
jgi:hypothetical protein